MTTTRSWRARLAWLIAALVVVTLSAGGAASAVTSQHRSATTASQGPIVQTEQGAVRGAALTQGFAFRGLPYAAAPTGNLRWRPPQPAAPGPAFVTRPQYAPELPAAAAACPRHPARSRGLPVPERVTPGRCGRDAMAGRCWCGSTAAA